MNVDTRAISKNTSAGSPMVNSSSQRFGAYIAACILAQPGTTAGLGGWTVGPWNFAWRPTSGGASVVPDDRDANAIAELRRLSGLTWAQLARLFGVTRRSLHFWASGKPLTPANEERLNRVLAIVRKIDSGSPIANRTQLLTPDSDGRIMFDLLAEGRYELLGSAVRGGVPTAFRKGNRLSKTARAARDPYPPERLIDARQDRIHVEKPRLLSARPIRIPRGK